MTTRNTQLALCIILIAVILFVGYMLATTHSTHYVENTTGHSITVNVSCANGAMAQVTIAAHSTIEVNQYCN